MDDAVLFDGVCRLAVDLQIPVRTIVGRLDAVCSAFGYSVVSGGGRRNAGEKSSARPRPIVLCSSDGVAQSVADSSSGEIEAVLLTLLLR